MADTILTAFITTLFTVALTYLGYWRNKEAELRKEFASRFNEQKWLAYKNYLIMLSRTVNIMKPDSAETRVALILVASDEVIKAYNDGISAFSAGDNQKRISSDARLLAEMRRDLGYNSKISPDELLRMFSSIQET